ncbi:hypothetical protein BC332_29546 [Capsicum chinense]|nr:hypothetical protein BC332_29546 [Capsicum chinense]
MKFVGSEIDLADLVDLGMDFVGSEIDLADLVDLGMDFVDLPMGSGDLGMNFIDSEKHFVGRGLDFVDGKHLGYFHNWRTEGRDLEWSLVSSWNGSVDSDGQVGELRDVSNKGNNAEIKVFLEVELCLDLGPLSPPGKVKEVILLFFKLYDPLEEKIRYVGGMFVNRSSKPLEILTKLNELAGF